MAARSDIKGQLISLSCAAAWTGVALFIRERYGLETLTKALPYLIGLPFAYLIFNIVRVSRGFSAKRRRRVRDSDISTSPSSPLRGLSSWG